VPTQVPQPHPGRQVMADQLAGRLREQGLATMASGADVRRPVHVQADKVPANLDRLAGVETPSAPSAPPHRVTAGQQEPAARLPPPPPRRWPCRRRRRMRRLRRRPHGRSAGRTAARSSCWCAPRTCTYRSLSRSSSRIEPSISVNSKVTVPAGRSVIIMPVPKTRQLLHCIPVPGEFSQPAPRQPSSD
jgi:hypothetical protein